MFSRGFSRPMFCVQPPVLHRVIPPLVYSQAEDYHRYMTITADIVEPDEGHAAMMAAACLFHGFSDRSRLVILQHLMLGEHRVVELTEHLGLAQSTVSKHLACLKDCGLVSSRPEGRASIFKVSHPEAIAELLTAAERLLLLTGYAVTLCPNHGADVND